MAFDISTGHYINIFKHDGKRDIYLVLNESNDEPTLNEVVAFEELIDSRNEWTLEEIRSAIWDSDFGFCDYGFALIEVVGNDPILGGKTMRGITG